MWLVMWCPHCGSRIMLLNNIFCLSVDSSRPQMHGHVSIGALMNGAAQLSTQGHF